MTWILWATLGYFLNATALAIDKALLSRRELKDPAAYTVLISTLGLLVFVLAPWGLERPTFFALLWGLISGACFTLAFWLMFKVLKEGEASRVPAFIGSLGPIFVFIGSYFFLNEHLVTLQILAFSLLVAGGILMVGGHGGLKKRSLILAIVASAVFSLAYVLIKLTFNQTNFITGLILTRVGGFVASLPLLAIPGIWKTLRGSGNSQSGVKFAFLGGQTAGALSGLLNSYAITLASVTLVNALQGVQYVFLLIMALVVSFRFPNLFQDEFSGKAAWRKVGGTILIVIGLALLSFAI